MIQQCPGSPPTFWSSASMEASIGLHSRLLACLIHQYRAWALDPRHRGRSLERALLRRVLLPSSGASSGWQSQHLGSTAGEPTGE